MTIAVIRRIETSRNTPDYYRTRPDGTRAGSTAMVPVVVECAIQETHAMTADVTRHPVEEGSDVTDYVRPGILGLDMQVAFSNQPMCSTPNRNGFVTPGDGRIQGVWQQFLDIIEGRAGGLANADRRNPQLLQVQTGLKLYDNMVISSVGTSQSADNPESVVIRVRMERIELVRGRSARVTPASALEEGETRNSASSTADGGDAVADTAMACLDCGLLCAACLKHDGESENVVDDNGEFIERREYIQDTSCINDGYQTLEGASAGNASEQTKQSLCEAIASGIADRNGVLFMDRFGLDAQVQDTAPLITGTNLTRLNNNDFGAL